MRRYRANWQPCARHALVERIYRLGLSQAEFARLAGVHPYSIVRWDSQGRLPRELDGLLEALEIMPRWAFEVWCDGRAGVRDDRPMRSKGPVA